MFSTFGRILEFWKPHRSLGIGLVITMMLRAVFAVVLALAIKFVIDQVIDPEPNTSVWTVAGLLAVGFLVSFGSGLVAAKLTAKATSEIIADVRTAAFNHLQRLPMVFHDRAAIGDLMAHFSSDIAQLSQGVIRKPLIGMRALTAMALYVPVMFLLDAGLAGFSVVVIPLVVYLVYRFAPASAEALDEEKKAIAEVLDDVSGNLRAQRIIRAYALGDQSRTRFTGRIARLREVSERAETRIGLEMVIAEYAVEFTKLLIIIAGAVLAFSGDLDPGSFAAFTAILVEFSYQASVFGMDVLPSIKQSEAGIRRIDRLLAVEAAPHEGGSVPTPTMSGTIEFDGVTFRYRPDGPAQLRGVSLTVPEQSYVAVVGPNGSGKSSLLNVLIKLYGIEEGSVVVDGVDLASVDTDDMRRSVGIAFQDTFLFNASLRENVTLGAAEVSDEVLERVITESGLDSIVRRLPDGLDTELTAEGVTLSAGETQRVGIARALLRDPALVLLDEVASGLDPESEAELTEAIEDLRHGRTIISVTHRLESIKTADLIAVIADGSVVETGTFGELLERDGSFATMWSKQHGFDVAANGLSARVHAERLRGIPIFADLESGVLEDLASAFESRYRPGGDVVFREGQHGDAFYVIARGVVEVVRGPWHGGRSNRRLPRGWRLLRRDGPLEQGTPQCQRAGAETNHVVAARPPCVQSAPRNRARGRSCGGSCRFTSSRRERCCPRTHLTRWGQQTTQRLN